MEENLSRTMLLSELLTNFATIPKQLDREINGIALDSREVQPGNLFCAYKGYSDSGLKYLEQAIKNGAAAVLCEIEIPTQISGEQNIADKNIPIIYLQNLYTNIGSLAARFYGNPSKDLLMIGITGTNGKTSCSQFIASALQMAGIKAGVIGTLGNGIYGALEDTQLTTPDAVTLQRTLAAMKRQDVKCVAMEVSSHGLDQNRHVGIDFDMAIFTNLTRDHLDYHRDMQAYKLAKRKLFDVPSLQNVIVNIDDEFGRELALALNGKVKVYGYSALGRKPEFVMPMVFTHQVNIGAPGLTASIETPWGEGVLHSNLMGRFNLNNLLATLTALGIVGIPLQEALGYLAKLEGVAGRMELFGGGDKPSVVVDFSHTPDALTQALMAVREYCQGELWCVFGCGGDRDPGKRPMMGRCAEMYADHVVITDDNPRHEQPQAIVSAILEGMLHPETAVVEHDRNRAIAHAITCAHPGDIVLIAGKGHEKYQQVGDEKRPFNDQFVVQMILTQIGE